jgi:hypothetical protein
VGQFTPTRSTGQWIRQLNGTELAWPKETVRGILDETGFVEDDLMWVMTRGKALSAKTHQGVTTPPPQRLTTLRPSNVHTLGVTPHALGSRFAWMAQCVWRLRHLKKKI